MLPIQNIQRPKAGRLRLPHFELIHFKQIYPRPDLQNDKSHKLKEDPPYQIMDGKVRHKGYISSNPHQKVHPSVPSLHDRPKTILFSVSPLRALHSSTRLNKNPKIPPYYSAGKTYKHHGLSRRLDALVSL